MSSGHDDGRIAALLTIIRENAPHLAFTAAEKHCVENHIAFWLFQLELVTELDLGRISKKQYLALFNERATLMMRLDKEALGSEAFYSIFGEEGDAIDEMIDPEMFLEDNPKSTEFMRYG